MAQERIGRYQILEEVAAGAQGTVHRAFDSNSGRLVAVKLLHPSLTGDLTYLERFRREATMAAAIDHPNVVQIYEVGEDRGRHFIAMEFIPENLARVIESSDGLSPDRAASFAAQIADGIAAAHAAGIVHRDIKPQNVLLAPDGTAKITDFGIARAEALSTMTASGVMMGTPYYMSPEQARGEPADARSDIYSFGCVLYQMLTGELPFKGTTPLAVLHAQINEEPKPIAELRPEIPAALAAMVTRAMAKDPGRRFQSAFEMVSELRTAVPSLPRATQPAPPLAVTPPTPPRSPAPPREPARPEMEPPRRQGRRILIGTLATAVLGAVAAGVLLVLTNQPDLPGAAPGGAVAAAPVATATPRVLVVAQPSVGPMSRRYAPEEVSGTIVAPFSAEERRDIAVTQIVIFSPSVAGPEVALSVAAASDRGPPGVPVLQVLDIGLSGVRAPETTQGSVEFEVPAAWLTQRTASMDRVRLYHERDGWDELPTAHLGTSSDSETGQLIHRFTATTPGFSLFAIGIAQAFVAPTPTPIPEPAAAPTSTAQPPPTPTSTATPTPRPTLTPTAPPPPAATATPVPAPTASPIPAPTASPTPNPTPTPTRTPIATPEAVEYMQILTGTGDAVESVELRPGLALFEARYTGPGNFVVWLQGAADELLVNEIGSYEGTTAVGVEGGSYLLDVQASDVWSVNIREPRHQPPTGATQFAAVGDGVTDFLWFDEGLYRVGATHDGSSNFVIWLLDDAGDRQDMLTNEIGEYDRARSIRIDVAGVYLFAVEADGGWTLAVLDP